MSSIDHLAVDSPRVLRRADPDKLLNVVRHAFKKERLSFQVTPLICNSSSERLPGGRLGNTFSCCC
jgi:hypothetical protein